MLRLPHRNKEQSVGRWRVKMKIRGIINCRCSNEFNFESRCMCAECNERAMGPEYRYVAELDEECPKCKTMIHISAECWEYPIGGAQPHAITVTPNGVQVTSVCVDLGHDNRER